MYRSVAVAQPFGANHVLRFGLACLLTASCLLAASPVLAEDQFTVQDKSVSTQFSQPGDNSAAAAGELQVVQLRHGLNRIFQEEVLAENVAAVRSMAFALPTADRFEFLSGWVLPAKDHPGFRMTGDVTQTQPAGVTQEPGVEHPEFGGQIVSPVFDWLDAGRELGRLPDCLNLVETTAAPDTEAQRRARISLRLLLNLELGNQSAATDGFGELYELIRLPTAEEQWAELLVIDRVVRRFATNKAAADFIAEIRTLKAQHYRPVRNSQWHAQSWGLVTRLQPVKTGDAEAGAETLAETESATGGGATAAFRDWIPVTAVTAVTRGQGYPAARWIRSEGKVLKRVAHGDDYLFYRSPLSGNYEVQCDLINSPQIMTSGSFLGPRLDQQALDLGTFRGAIAAEPVTPPFSTFWPTVRFRAVIRDGTRSISINGRPVKSETLPDNVDPWLAIRSSGQSESGVQNLRITGQPMVLDSVSLSGSRELAGWISYHGEPVLHESQGWTHVADPDSTGSDSTAWIVGHPQPAVEGMSFEGLLRYQRPLVEDGTIAYEFFYEPDVFETHPALDRLAFILHSDGVREHWIGDGRYDRTLLDPRNMTDVAECRRGPSTLPLKAGAWNQLRLSLRGRTVTVELNDQLVYERSLEPLNQRTFGLFHFLGNSSVRVRNAVMSGDWPKTVPSVEAQELGDATVDRLTAELSGLKAVFSHDFQKDGIPEHFFKAPGPGLTHRLIPGPTGVQTSQRAAGTHVGFNIYPRFSLGGDFDIELAFTGLRIEGSGDAGIMLNATVEQGVAHEYRALRMKTTPGNHELQSSVSMVRPDGGRTYVSDWRSFESLRGRIRLVRRGQRVYYLFAENDSDDFFLFGSEPALDADTTADGIFLHTFCNGVSISQVTWTKLVLRAERIRWYSPTPPNPRDYLSVMQADGKGLRIVASPKSVGFTTVGSPEWSPDHRQIVMEMSRGEPSKSHIFVVNADGTDLKDLGEGCIPGFSSDGTRIVCSVPEKGIVTMQSDGTAREILSATGWGAQWSMDGTRIAFIEGDNITLFDVNSRTSSKLLRGEIARRYRSIMNLGWSNDGRSITFKAERRDVARQELCQISINPASGDPVAGEFTILHPNAHAISPDIMYSPDDQQVIVGIAGIASRQSRLYSLNRGQPGPATPVFAADITHHKISGYAWSRDGKWIAITSSRSAPYVEWINGPIND